MLLGKFQQLIRGVQPSHNAMQIQLRENILNQPLGSILVFSNREIAVIQNIFSPTRLRAHSINGIETRHQRNFAIFPSEIVRILLRNGKYALRLAQYRFITS